MKSLVPVSDNLKQGITTSLDFLTEKEGNACGFNSTLYLLNTFHAWYSGYENKLTTVPQEVDSVVGRPGA